MLIRIDDAAKESQFHIKAMALRPEWDRNQNALGSRGERHDHLVIFGTNHTRFPPQTGGNRLYERFLDDANGFVIGESD